MINVFLQALRLCICDDRAGGTHLCVEHKNGVVVLTDESHNLESTKACRARGMTMTTTRILCAPRIRDGCLCVCVCLRVFRFTFHFPTSYLPTSTPHLPPLRHATSSPSHFPPPKRHLPPQSCTSHRLEETSKHVHFP